jgi:hypothetical protein
MIPDFSAVKKRIPVSRILSTPDQSKRAAMHFARLYKELGGNKRLGKKEISFPCTYRAGEVAADLESPVSELCHVELMSKVFDHLQGSQFCMRDHVDNHLSRFAGTGYRRQQQDAVVVINIKSPYLLFLDAKLFHDAPVEVREVAKVALALFLHETRRDMMPFPEIANQMAPAIPGSTTAVLRSLREYRAFLKGVPQGKAALRASLTAALPQLPAMRRQWAEELLRFGKLADTVSYHAMPLVQGIEEQTFFSGTESLVHALPWQALWSAVWGREVGLAWQKRLEEHAKKFGQYGVSMYVRNKKDLDAMARLMAYSFWKNVLIEKADRWSLRKTTIKEGTDAEGKSGTVWNNRLYPGRVYR